MAIDQLLQQPRPPSPPPEIQRHRQRNNPSKLPSFRYSDAQIGCFALLPTSDAAVAGHDSEQVQLLSSVERQSQGQCEKPVGPRRSRTTSAPTSIATSTNDSGNSDHNSPPEQATVGAAIVPHPCQTFQPKPATTRRPPASRQRSAINVDSRPPLAMTTQKSYFLEHSRTPSTSNPTTDAWVANQQTISLPSPSTDSKSNPPTTTQAPSANQSLPGDERRTSRPKILPIRQFKPSRHSTDMGASRPAEQDDDDTLRALEGYSMRTSTHQEQDEQNSDDSDLFLKMAREEELARQQETSRDLGLPSRSNSKRSRTGLEKNRQSLPPIATYQPVPRARRVSEQESAVGSRVEGQEGVAKALTYHSSSRDRPSALDDINRFRYYGVSSRSTPTTPRGFGNRDSREVSPESQVPYAGRRPSIPDHSSVLPRTSSYRQSNLSYSGSRTYNSSPLVSRSMDMNESHDTPRVAGTESTGSTTAPSTVWDELEDLKSRIHRLELTGKLPATSGAAISHASAERPPTATTTVTTMSTSPKRNSGNSNTSPESAAAPLPGDSHPLLQAALAKSKPLLTPEVFSALEATTSDALAIAAMMGTSGQPGPISSSQSTIGGGAASVTDRQVRRKADSMCRSLTELCLALSEIKTEPAQANNNPVASGPKSSDDEVIQSIEISPPPQRQPTSSDLARVKGSPRALSRLEARRSSLLATSGLPSPRYVPSEAGTPTQATMSGRRTSLFLRPRRAGTEEREEEEDASRFRTPSRAITEINRPKASPREYNSQQPMPDTRPSVVQSSLPVRRHYASTSLPDPGAPASPATLGPRRYLDRPTPERETNVVSRLAEDRGQRKSSIGSSFGLTRLDNLNRRARQTSAEPTPAGQGYRS